ncbi:MAG: hypothetical protein ACI81R_001331 [Bradymonadia bacterium]|jgi:hypothetical protein
MRDGGYIAQSIEQASAAVPAVTNAEGRCLTNHTAPLDRACEDSADTLAECESKIAEEPVGWKNSDFDDSSWVAANPLEGDALGAKDDYAEII